MKHLIKCTAIGTIAFVILVLSSQITQAQQRGQQGPPPMPDDEQIESMVEDLSKELNMTEDQEKQVSEKYFAHFDEVKVKLEKGRPERKEMETLKSDFEEDIKAMLTDEQKDLYATFLKVQEQNRPQSQKR